MSDAKHDDKKDAAPTPTPGLRNVPAPATAPQKAPKVTSADIAAGRVFRVRDGSHVENGPDGKEKLYNKASGPFVSTTPELLRSWPEKFEAVGGTMVIETKHADPFDQLPDESAAAYTQRMRALAEKATKAANETVAVVPHAPPAPKGPDLTAMSVDQLRKFAAEREIKLAGHMSRADILKAIQDDLAE